MGYPFHKATELTTAKCTKCGKRIVVNMVHYRYVRDKKIIESGHYGVQDEWLIIDRMIETFCSVRCAKNFTDVTVTLFEKVFEEYLVDLCKQRLHPMTRRNTYVNPSTRKKTCRICKRLSMQKSRIKMSLLRRAS